MNALYTLISIVHSHGSWRTKVDSEQGWKSLHWILARAFDKTLVLCATSYSTVLHIWQAYISKQVYNNPRNHFNKELISSQTDGSIVIRDDRTDEGCVRNSTFPCNIHLSNRNAPQHSCPDVHSKETAVFPQSHHYITLRRELLRTFIAPLPVFHVCQFSCSDLKQQ